MKFGSIGMTISNSMMGEVTPKMVEAIGSKERAESGGWVNGWEIKQSICGKGGVGKSTITALLALRTKQSKKLLTGCYRKNIMSQNFSF